MRLFLRHPVVLAAALAGCAATGPADPDPAPSPAPDGPYADEDRRADRSLYEARCGVCHVPFHPQDYARDEWPGIVATFAPRAGLTRTQRTRVLRYLADAGPRTVADERSRR